MKLTRTTRIVALLALTVLPRAGRAQSGEDPSGFTQALNAARAQRGLAPVAHDPAAAATARQNNLCQMARGLGHWARGSYGQCSAVGMGDAASALAAWSNSPSHAAIIFDPSLASVGFDVASGCATVSTTGGGTASYQATTTWSYSAATYSSYVRACSPAIPRRRGLFGRRRW